MSRLTLLGCVVLALIYGEFKASPTPASGAERQETEVATALPQVSEGTGYGQITFINSTSATLVFYINGDYAGRSLPGLTYTAQARAGSVTLVAHDEAGGRTVSTSGYLEEGASASWEITQSE